MTEDQHPITDRELVRRIGRSAGQKAGYKQLVRELGLGGGRERRLLTEQLAHLVARRELMIVNNDMWAIPPAPEAKAAPSKSRFAGMEETARSGRDRLQSGRLDLHRDGFGFVRMDGANGRKAGASGEPDIFIPPNEINGAMQGDLVLVDEMPPDRDGRRSGRIARVLTRRNPTVVGIFHYGSADRLRERGDRGTLLHGNYVTPLDERVASLISIPDGAEIVAAAAETPNRTLSEEARRRIIAEPLQDSEAAPKKRFRRENAKPLEGLAVDVEITDFPGPGRPARGRVIEVLGKPDDFGVDVEIVIRKHHIPHAFPPGVLAEATAQAEVSAATLTAEELTTREDFRGLNIVTIDGETAKDFDDAVLVQALANGNTELQVHIADVSWYVRPESALDTEARVRGNSVYFPDRAVPMLPHALSSGMCSLLPNEDRLVMSCVMEIDPAGEVLGYRVAEGIIRSVRRCTYTSVQQCLNASAWRQETGNRKQETATAEDTTSAEDIAERERVGLEQPELLQAFDDMLALALRLNAKRVRRGSIDFDLPEPIVQFDPDGNMKAIVKSERGWAHRLIEEFMLSANECVARWLEDCGIASIYRIHEMPDPKRIVDFEETAASFGQSLGIGNLPVKKLTMKADRRDIQRSAARGRDTRKATQHELPAKIPVTPQMYQKLVRRIAGTPEERILAYLMLRSLKQARYAEKNEGHFALASPSYTHFTSPIRRYPDLIVHRLLRAMLTRGADPQGAAIRSTDAQPWQTELDRSKGKGAGPRAQGPEGRNVPRSSTLDPRPSTDDPITAAELNDIASECSQTERRAADAERELIEQKKIKFMESRVGEDFHATILSVTKYGFFIELDDLFIEGLVPLTSLVGDFYSFRDTDRSICGSRTGHCFKLGQRVEVILDRIDRQLRRLQFALLPGTEPSGDAGMLRAPSLRRKKVEDTRITNPAKPSKRSGKSKTRQRNKKLKGKR